jgi:hypothetical protein
MFRILELALLICTLLTFATSRSEAADNRPIPDGVKLSLVFDKESYFLGENVLVHLCVENTSPTPFKIDLGGDYRGSTRHLRFKVLATDEQGKVVADPDPFPMNMGGLGYSKEIKQGDRHYETLQLLRYRRFEKAGVYRLRVTHDFGWSESDPSKRPSAIGTIKFVMPDRKEALQVIEEMEQLPKNYGSSAGQKCAPFADFTTLIYPVYLPLLAARADLGEQRALEALGAMPSADATKELIRLLSHNDPAFARSVLTTLQQRLPDPALDRKVGPSDYDYWYRRRNLVERSWKPEFAPAVRKVACDLLKKKDVESLQSAAYLVVCLGTAEELPLLIKALDHAATEAVKLPRPRDRHMPPRGACQDLVRAAGLLCQRGASINEKPASPGEFLLSACAVGSREKFRPKGWEETFVVALRHELPFVREIAVNNLPSPPPAEAGKLIAGLIEDKDVDVQIAACHFAVKWKAAHLRGAVLRTLKSAKEQWLFTGASDAARELGAFKERVEILVDRLDEQGMTVRCLTQLVGMIEDTNGYGNRTELDVETGKTCKQAWQRFLERNAETIKADRKFKLADPGFPAAELFPQFTFYRR